MTLLLFILSFAYSQAVYIPYSGTIGEINIKSLLKHDLASANLTSEDSHLNITGLVNEHGYIIEEHKVTTDDGYILSLHRLRRNNTCNGGVQVFLMHGLMDSSESWVLQGPENALGYLLHQQGFDVWMGNARGNKYSSTHTELTANQEQFWRFSWEEIGFYDLPAMIDYVLMKTDKEALHYVGHSQGTTTFFVMTSLKPDYVRKIRMMFALSPIAWLTNAKSPMLKYLSNIHVTTIQYMQFFNAIPTSSEFLNQIYSNMCKVISNGCGNIFQMLFGNNYFVSDSMLPVIVERASTSSLLQLVHYWQLYQSGRFCRFDYGWMRNLFEYGTFSPPDYDLSGINVPIIMFYSGNDWLSHPSDVFTLQSHLPNVYISYYSNNFSHIDYLYASVAKEAVYEKIISRIQDLERS